MLHHVTLDFVSVNGNPLTAIQPINDTLAAVRMPLFSFLSGLIYAYRPVERGSITTFMAKKVRRLLIPFVALTAILIAMKAAFPSATHPVSILDMPAHLLYGYAHLWFLQSLFVIFLLMCALDAFTENKRVGYGVAIVLAALAYATPLAHVEVFSLGGAVYLLPFFLLGAWSSTAIEALERHRAGLLAGLGAASAAVLAVLYVRAQGGSVDKMSGFSLAASAVLLMFVFLATPRVGFLSRMGRYSFSIYLFHSIFIALAVRIVGPHPAMVAVVLAVALIGPVVAEVIIDRRLPVFSPVIGKRWQGFGVKRAATAQ